MAIYTASDLNEQERTLLQTRYSTFKERFGGMASSLSRELCLALHCSESGLDSRLISDLMSVQNCWGSGGWVERWACRWIVTSRKEQV